MKLNYREKIKKAVGIVVGSFIYAGGISLFLDPNNLAPGGLVGISVILNRIISIETGTLYFVLNIPVILLGLWKFGFRFMLGTFGAILCSSFFTNLLSGYGAITSEPLLAAIAGSIMVGVGIGIVFLSGATTGGMDIVIKVLREKYKHLKTGFLFLVTDIIIVTISGFIFRDFNIAMYALIAVAVSGKVLDYVLYGGDEAKLIYIISNSPESITERILAELDVGVTHLLGKGAYSKQDKQVIMCVVRKNQGPHVEEIVKQEDKDAFMIITSANEIYGEGYKNIMNEKI